MALVLKLKPLSLYRSGCVLNIMNINARNETALTEWNWYLLNSCTRFLIAVIVNTKLQHNIY